jgi:hypothetical protein
VNILDDLALICTEQLEKVTLVDGLTPDRSWRPEGRTTAYWRICQETAASVLMGLPAERVLVGAFGEVEAVERIAAQVVAGQSLLKSEGARNRLAMNTIHLVAVAADLVARSEEMSPQFREQALVLRDTGRVICLGHTFGLLLDGDEGVPEGRRRARVRWNETEVRRVTRQTDPLPSVRMHVESIIDSVSGRVVVDAADNQVRLAHAPSRLAALDGLEKLLGWSQGR